MTIRDSLSFNYAGINSDDMGIINVNLDGGMQEEPFAASRKINEIKIKGNPRPYFQGIEYEPLEFTVNFAFENFFNDESIRDVAKWLTGQEYYQPLYFSSDTNRIYYALVVDKPSLIHNCLSQGYVKLTFRCDSPYAYTPEVIKEYDLLNNPTTTNITINNTGDLLCKPLVCIEKSGNGDISIINTSNGNKETRFSNLFNNEVIYLYNEEEIIQSNKRNTFSNFNYNFLELVVGNNILTISGTCTLTITYQFKLI